MTPSKPSQNSITLTPQGWLLVTQVGFQDKESFRTLVQLIFIEVERLRAKNKPVIILVDLSQDMGHAKGSETEVAKVLAVPFEIMAIYAPKLKDRFIIKLIAVRNKGNDRVRAFKTKKAAENWLKKFAS